MLTEISIFLLYDMSKIKLGVSAIHMACQPREGREIPEFLSGFPTLTELLDTRVIAVLGFNINGQNSPTFTIQLIIIKTKFIIFLINSGTKRIQIFPISDLQ